VLERAEAGGGRLPPEQLDATVLFCDLRGFTTFAERHAVPIVIETLDRHLAEVAEAVMTHGGTVVAFLGDGAMAVFGAPEPQEDHADRALSAARELIGSRLDRLNAWLVERRIDHRFEAGVGLHSGPVMSGTVGSERRIEYAAVGDTTNVAARLQAYTQEAGVPLLLSDATRARLDENALLRPLGGLRLRGRETPIVTWTLEGYGSSPKGGLRAKSRAETLAPDEATDAPG
jgi:adenylate cyclase